MKEFCRDGHIAFSYLLLQKQFEMNKIKIDHGRDLTMFLSLAVFDILDSQEFIEKVRDPIQKQIIRGLKLHYQDMQNIMMLIQCAVILDFDIQQYINIQDLVDQIISCQLQNGSFQASTEPNSYTDVRDIGLALISLYLLKIRYNINIDSLNTVSIQSYLTSLETPDFFISQSPYSEGHAGGVFLTLISQEMLQRLGYKLVYSFNHRRIVNRLVNLQQFLLAGRPNKPPCLCYHLWSYGSLKLLNQQNLLNHESLLNMTLEAQFQVKLPDSVIQQLLQPFQRLEDCNSKQDFYSFLYANYKTIFMGFGADQIDPDALHTFSPLMYLAGQNFTNQKIDFATFLTEKKLKIWQKE
eukprot:EST42038.1 hypothetical protein SS50377_18345 [Spironucleus salmonicida]